VREGLTNPSESMLPRLDDAARRAWRRHFDYQSTTFHAHRAASGLAWATMGAIIATVRCQFQSLFVGIQCNAENAQEYGVGLVARECERALAIVFSKAPDGWLKVAQSFTAEMEKPESPR